MVNNKTDIYDRFFYFFCKWKISLIQIRTTPQVKYASAILNTGKLPNDKKSLTHPRKILSIKFQIVPAINKAKSSTVRYFLWNR
jgi:hypothetical protein